ncbi:MAG: hypothetical protein ACRYHQ_02135 [Janthinobacterium lividum]
MAHHARCLHDRQPGTGLAIVEAMAVEAAGRTTAGFLGLYSDANEAAMPRLMSDTHSHDALVQRQH